MTGRVAHPVDPRAGHRHGDEAAQALKAFDPEWARAFSTGSVTDGGDHATMLYVGTLLRPTR